jgi:hypothetical protein
MDTLAAILRDASLCDAPQDEVGLLRLRAKRNPAIRVRQSNPTAAPGVAGEAGVNHFRFTEILSSEKLEGIKNISLYQK